MACKWAAPAHLVVGPGAAYNPATGGGRPAQGGRARRMMAKTTVAGTPRTLYEVIEEPVPHILRGSRKQLHGWWPGPRECTSDRLLINPYNGCSHSCPFCYAQAFRGFFDMFRRDRIIAVWPDLDRAIASQLDSIDVAHCGYLSPATDPFQPIDTACRLSERIIAEFVKRNLPIEFITKGAVPKRAISLLASQPHSFGQVSVLTPHEKLNRKLCPGGVAIKALAGNLESLASAGVYAVARIDPVVPYITDGERDLERLVRTCAEAGAKHVVASCLDIPLRLKESVRSWLRSLSAGSSTDPMKVFVERKGAYLHAGLDYRRRLFSTLRDMCARQGVTFALCMEFDLSNSHSPRGLNADFMTSRNCEGMDVPAYIRMERAADNGHPGRFEPFDCDGACLLCAEARCGIPELAKRASGLQERQYKIADYRRWSRTQGKRRQGTQALDPKDGS